MVANSPDSLVVKSFSNKNETVQSIEGTWTVRGQKVTFTYNANIQNSNKIAAYVVQNGEEIVIPPHLIQGLILSTSPMYGPNSILTKTANVVKKYFSTSKVDLFPYSGKHKLIFRDGSLS